jgi:hypothetical protein
MSPFHAVHLSKLHESSDNFIRVSPGARRVVEVLDQVRNNDREFGFVRKILGVLFCEFQFGHLNFRKAFGWEWTGARHMRNVSIIIRAIPGRTRFTFIHNEICDLLRNKEIYSFRGWIFL